MRVILIVSFCDFEDTNLSSISIVSISKRSNILVFKMACF